MWLPRCQTADAGCWLLALAPAAAVMCRGCAAEGHGGRLGVQWRSQRHVCMWLPLTVGWHCGWQAGLQAGDMAYLSVDHVCSSRCLDVCPMCTCMCRGVQKSLSNNTSFDPPLDFSARGHVPMQQESKRAAQSSIPNCAECSAPMVEHKKGAEECDVCCKRIRKGCWAWGCDKCDQDVHRACA